MSQTLTIVLNADGSGLIGTVRLSAAELQRLGVTADRTGAQLGGAGARARGAATGVDALGRSSRQTDRGVRGLASGLNTLRGTLATLGISVVAREMLRASLETDRLERSTAAALGSQAAAARELAFVRLEAERLGIYFPVLARGYAGLAAATRGTTLAGAQTREIFLAVAEAGRAMNLSADQIQGTLVALQQMAGKGTISMEELRQQLGDRLPGAMQIAARSMGLTVAEFVKMVSEGEVLATDFLPKFAKELRAASVAGVELAKSSPAAEFERLKTALFDAAAAVSRGGLLEGLANVARATAQFLRSLTDSGALERFGALLVTGTKIAVAYFAVYRVALPLLTALPGLFTRLAAAVSLSNAAFTAGLAASTAASIKSIGLVRLALGGLFAAFAGWEIGKWLRENFLEAQLAGIAFVKGMLTYAERVRRGFKQTFAEIEYAIKKAFEVVGNASAAGYEKLAAGLERIGLDGLAEKYRAAANGARVAQTATAEYETSIASINAAYDESVRYIDQITGDMADYAIEQHAARNAANAAAGAEDGLAVALDGTAEMSEKARKELERLLKARRAFMDETERMRAQLLGDAAVAEVDYRQSLADADRRLASGEITAAMRDDRASVLRDQRTEALRAAAAERERADAIGEANRMFQEEIYLSQLGSRERRIEEQVMQAVNKAYEDSIRLKDASLALDLREQQQLREILTAREDLADFLAVQDAAAEEYRASWRNAVDSVSRAFGDWMSGGLRSFRDFARALKSIARQLLSDLIAQFSRNSLVPAISGWLQQLSGGQTGGGGGGLFGAIGNLVRNVVGGFTSPAAANGLQNAYGAATGRLAPGAGVLAPQYGGGALAGAPMGAGGSGMGGMPGGFWTGEFAGGMPYAGAALGLTGLYYGLTQRGNGGLSSGLAGLSYGALGVGVGGAIAGGLGALGTAAGVGGMGAGAIGGATGAMGALGSAAWVPVVGWILAAAAVIDMISGGKLFGTKYKPDKAAVQLEFGPDGIGGFREQTDVRQRSLFRGREWRTRQSDLPADVQQAIDDLFEDMARAIGDAARIVGVDVPEMIVASFRAEYDKKGKLKREFGIIAGRTYEESQEEFFKRLAAENALQVAKQVFDPGEVDALAEPYRATADALAEFAELMLVIAGDVNNARQLWTAGGEGTLSEVIGLIERLAQGSETLAQTYSRVMGIAQQYGEVIGGARTEILTAGLNQYQRAQLDIELSYRRQVDQANELARSLGLSGARSEDLATLEEWRAHKMAELQAALENQRDTFLEDLGLSNLSPFTDRQKLESAMGAFRDAVADGDLQRAQQLSQAVLGLGRNLFASGSDFNALYGEVTGLLGGLDPADMGFTDAALRDIADTLDTLAEDIGRALIDSLLAAGVIEPPATTPPPPPPPPPGGGGGDGRGGGRGGTGTTYEPLLPAIQRLEVELARIRQATETQAGDTRGQVLLEHNRPAGRR